MYIHHTRTHTCTHTLSLSLSLLLSLSFMPALDNCQQATLLETVGSVNDHPAEDGAEFPHFLLPTIACLCYTITLHFWKKDICTLLEMYVCMYHII